MVKFTRKRTSFKKRAYKRRASAKMVSSMVKQQLAKQVEKKQWLQSNGLKKFTDYGNITFNNDNVVPLTPTVGQQLGQGVGMSQRIGNKVRITKATLEIIVYPAPYDNQGNEVNLLPQPYDVRMIICHGKQTPSEVIVSGTFFDNGNTTRSPTDNLQDMMIPVNKDLYVVSKDIKFKVGNADYEGNASSTVNNYYANNDYKLNYMRKFDITKYLPKNIEWNDSQAIPSSFIPSACFFIAPAVGTNTPTGQFPLEYYSEIQIDFTDM